jgi:predicted transcriptional regulator of viral defense system
MENIDVRMARLAVRQHAVFTGQQAQQVGMSRRQLDARLAKGIVVRVHRNVYRLAGSPPTHTQALMAATLATGGVVSHRAAAAHWGFRGCPPGPVEVLVAARRRPDIDGVTAHATTRLDPVDVTVREAVPVTTPARTLVDLGAVAPPEVVESAFEHALLHALVSYQWVERTLERLARQGRNGCGGAPPAAGRA